MAFFKERRNRMQHLLLILNVALLLSLVLAGPAAAAITVDCDGGAADHATINAALAAANHDFETINITGTCDSAADRTVSIVGFKNLNLLGPATISQPMVACDSPVGAPAVLRIDESDGVRLEDLVIQGGGGVLVSDSKNVNAVEVTIENSRTVGLRVGTNAQMFASRSVIQNNCSVGVSVIFGSRLSVSGGEI
jgi:hypothetical protein